MTILLTTHYLDEAERLCDRVAIIHAGRIVALDTPAALRRRARRRARRAARRQRPGRRARRAARARHRRPTTPSPSARRSRCPCTAAARRDAIARIHERGLARRLDQRPDSPRSTTSTCSSPAAASPTPPDRRKEPTMATLSPEAALPSPPVSHAARSRRSRRSPRGASSSPSARRASCVVPLLTPILFALVIAPALKQALHTRRASYEAFVATGTIGLADPAEHDVRGPRRDRRPRERRPARAAGRTDPARAARARQPRGRARDHGAAARRADRAALRPRHRLRRERDGRRSGSSRAAALFTIGMYGVAETLASRVPRTEEYIARVPAIAIVPWFLAGSLFPISATARRS